MSYVREIISLNVSPKERLEERCLEATAITLGAATAFVQRDEEQQQKQQLEQVQKLRELCAMWVDLGLCLVTCQLRNGMVGSW